VSFTLRVAAVRVEDAAGQVLSLLADGVDVVVELVAPDGVDLQLLDRLARLVLAGRRLPGELTLVPACGDVRRLAQLTGFCEALGFSEAQRFSEAQGKAQPLEGLPAELLQEVVDVADPPV
jgi:hypothetical protein